MADELQDAIRTFNRIVDLVEARCLAADGPVTPTLKEMDERELAELWRAVQTIGNVPVMALVRKAQVMIDKLEANPVDPESGRVFRIPPASFLDRNDAIYAAWLTSALMMHPDRQFDAATKLAANVGYELAADPPQADAPVCGCLMCRGQDSPIPGMSTHRGQSLFFADAIKTANTRRKMR